MRNVLRKVPCLLCNRNFKTYEHLKMHVKDKHKHLQVKGVRKPQKAR